MKVILITLIASLAIASSLDLLRSVNHQETIDEINSKAQTWIAGENQRFDKMKLEEVKRLLGAMKTPLDQKLGEKEYFVLENLPENFDLREAYPTCESLREIRDQSTCGSCWAFGAAEAMSDRICIASKGQLQTRISSEHILSCCSECGYGCDGGWLSPAWKFYQKKGVPTGGLYNDFGTCQPYTFAPCDHHVEGKYGPCSSEEFPTPECKHECNPKYHKSFAEDKWFAESAYTVKNDEKAIMTEIYLHGSVELAFDVYEDFVNYKSGVYEHVHGKMLGGHAIKAIGWGVENGVKYWILVNSWNEGWGEKGVFRFIRGKNSCGIESDVTAGIPILKSTGRNFMETLFEQ